MIVTLSTSNAIFSRKDLTNTMLKIEKGVPITPSHRVKSKSKWSAIDSMDIGDSFVLDIPRDKKGDEKGTQYNRLYSKVWNAFAKRKYKCLIRKTAPNQIRVWRISKYQKKNAALRVVGE